MRTDFGIPSNTFRSGQTIGTCRSAVKAAFVMKPFGNAAFGSGPQDANGYALQRYLVHADLRAGRHVRVFTEIQSGLESDRTGGPRPTDEDRLEFHQVFAEFRTGSSPHLFSLRVGRQEVAFDPAA